MTAQPQPEPVRRPALKQASGPQYTRIYSYGAARGGDIVPNDDLVGPIDSSDEWIRRRTGIVTRRRAPREVKVEHLAEDAGRSALEASGVDASEIDAVIVSTVSWLQSTPGMAPQVASRLGIPDAAAYDVNAGCAGYCYGIGQADAMIRSGLARHVMVIGAEKLSDIGDPTDRSLSFIIGDGAGAAVLGPSDVPGIGPTVWGSEGTKADVITMTHSWLDFKYAEPGTVAWPTVYQEGPSVFRWVISAMPDIAERAIAEAGLTPADIDVFIPHQANVRIIHAASDVLGFPRESVFKNIERYGNTSAGSIPIALDELLRDGQISRGDLLLTSGFGAGLNWGTILWRW